MKQKMKLGWKKNMKLWKKDTEGMSEGMFKAANAKSQAQTSGQTYLWSS